MRSIIQKLKVPLLLAIYVSVFTFSGVFTSTSFAAGACSPSKAPTGTNCGKLAIGCPGSTLQGPVSATRKLTCKYGPAKGSSYTCPAASCSFTDGTQTLKLGQGIDSSGKASKTPVASTTCPVGQTGTPPNCSAAPATLTSTDCSTGLSSCGLVQNYLNPFIKFLSAFVGLAVVISVVIGGIQYGGSAGDPQKTAAAKTRIRNSIIALITFIFLLGMLNFLIPGGLR